MTYIIGDICGNKEKYEKILEKINPTDTDAVFVIGNVLCGESGIEILQDILQEIASRLRGRATSNTTSPISGKRRGK
jgi:hypothetical protein